MEPVVELFEKEEADALANGSAINDDENNEDGEPMTATDKAKASIAELKKINKLIATVSSPFSKTIL